MSTYAPPQDVIRTLNMDSREITGKNYRVLYDPDLATISFQGELSLSGLAEYAAIAHLLESIAAQKLPAITLNLKELEFLNSTGINVLSKFAIALRRAQTTQLTVIGSQKIFWQEGFLKNLERLLPTLKLELI